MLDDKAVGELELLISGRFPPHNQLGVMDQSIEKPAYSYVKKRDLPDGTTGNVVVGCMKDEGPYIIEWIAYHQAIGFDNFLIFTNNCSDGTVEILERLEEMGVLAHVDNTDWKGQSPQQCALNIAVEHPMVQNADWVAHFDVDEFVNIHLGNGRLDDFFAAIPEATNITLTWRLFGHNGITKLDDTLVIDQFDQGAPKYCPKPHNSWGFKTLYKNFGAYQKLSCHRPNKVVEEKRNEINWFNGSGKPIHGKIIDNGWRSNEKSIGYDIVHLNHYALRSAESFLLKRTRGRALHVDQSIGLTYWSRMDFNSYPDVSIQRNSVRTAKHVELLKADETLNALHEKSFRFHQDSVATLKENEEFQQLHTSITNMDLNDLERVALILSQDE